MADTVIVLEDPQEAEAPTNDMHLVAKPAQKHQDNDDRDDDLKSYEETVMTKMDDVVLAVNESEMANTKDTQSVVPEAGAVNTHFTDDGDDVKWDEEATSKMKEGHMLSKLKKKREEVPTEMKCEGVHPDCDGQPLVYITNAELIKEKGYRTGFICNICREHDRREGSYHCALCNYDVCPDCYKERDMGKFQIFLNRLPRRLGKFLRASLFLSWGLNLHVFLCCCLPCAICVFNEVDSLENCCEYFMALFAISWMCATPFVVTLYLINEVGDFYPEVQSWQISYCVWGCSCGLLCLVAFICDKKGIIHKFQNWILWPFGIQVNNNAGILLHLFFMTISYHIHHTLFYANRIYCTFSETSVWAIPLVSVAVAIVGGFVANYALEQRFLLNCGSSYSEGMCYHDVCCQPVGSHQFVESGRFVGDFASNILAAWGVVKGLAYFIVIHDKSVQYEDTAVAQLKQKLDKQQSETEKQLGVSIKNGIKDSNEESQVDFDEESRVIEIESSNVQIDEEAQINEIKAIQTEEIEAIQAEDGDEVGQSQESPAEILTFAPTPESPNEETGDNKV